MFYQEQPILKKNEKTDKLRKSKKKRIFLYIYICMKKKKKFINANVVYRTEVYRISIELKVKKERKMMMM